VSVCCSDVVAARFAIRTTGGTIDALTSTTRFKFTESDSGDDDISWHMYAHVYTHS
jgi:thymidine phosphorylase